MLTRSAGALQIDLPRSLMVGDRMGDLEAGANAGCHSSLVRTGYGSSISLDFDPKSLRFLGAFQTLEQAVDAWLNLK